jgi:hypothetical protein
MDLLAAKIKRLAALRQHRTLHRCYAAQLMSTKEVQNWSISGSHAPQTNPRHHLDHHTDTKQSKAQGQDNTGNVRHPCHIVLSDDAPHPYQHRAQRACAMCSCVKGHQAVSIYSSFASSAGLPALPPGAPGPALLLGPAPRLRLSPDVLDSLFSEDSLPLLLDSSCSSALYCWRRCRGPGVPDTSFVSSVSWMYWRTCCSSSGTCEKT